MKKVIIGCFLILYIFCSVTIVSAINYDTYVLIPADTSATVRTDVFHYNDFIYHSTPNEKGNCSVEFQSIQNVTNFKKPVSINLLLFDANRLNIGFLTYCTDKDVSSDYNGFKLAEGQSTPFTINVTARYFIEGKTPSDVRYVAVMDENEYCQIGGYSKYQGLTVQEIYGGGVVNPAKRGYHFRDILHFFRNADLQVIVVTAAVVFFIAITYGLVINAFHKKLFLKYSAWAYVPVTNTYLATKMICGDIIAKYFTGFHIVSILLFFLNINFFILVSLVIMVILFLVISYKLVTKKYETLYYDPRVVTQKATNESYSMSDYYSNLDSNGNFKGESTLQEEYVFENSKDKVSSDLTYNTQTLQEDYNFGEDDTRENGAFQMNENDMRRVENQNTEDKESDLSNYFK